MPEEEKMPSLPSTPVSEPNEPSAAEMSRAGSLEISRTTSSQRIALDQFIESPSNEGWLDLVGSMRRRLHRQQHPPAADVQRIELIEDGIAPIPPTEAMADDSAIKYKDYDARPELIHNDDGPAAPGFMQPDIPSNGKSIFSRSDHHVAASYTSAASAEQNRNGSESLPSNETGVELETNSSLQTMGIMVQPGEGLNTGNDLIVTEDMGDDESSQVNGSENVAIVRNAQTQDPAHFIPEAILVDSQDVVVGTPLEPQIPWWKQRNALLLLALVCIVVVVLSITLGVTLSSDKDELVKNIIGDQESPQPSLSSYPSSSPSFSRSPSDAPTITPTLRPSYSPSKIPSSTPAPSISARPSVSPSSSPSFSPSQEPSLFPSITISPTLAHLDTLVETDCDDCYMEVGIYEDNAVVVTGGVDIQFFTLTNSSTFELVTKLDIEYIPTSVAINDNTVVIGSYTENRETGAAFVYEKDRSGNWYQVVKLEPRGFKEGMDGSEHFISSGPLFGRSVSIDSGKIIVGADDDGEEGDGSAYIYRRDQDSWDEEVKLSPHVNSTAEGYGYSMSIKGNTAVVGDVAYGDSQEGAILIYEYESLSQTWNQAGSTLMRADCNYFFARGTTLSTTLLSKDQRSNMFSNKTFISITTSVQLM